MNMKSLIAMLILGVIGGTGVSSTADGVAPHSHGNLKYFGFAGIDAGKVNYVDEISGFANVGQMCVYLPKDSLAKRIAAFDRAEVKAIVLVESILFERSKATTLSKTKLTLRHDAASRWRAFVDLNQESLVPKHVVAIFVVDEPAWNNVSVADFTRAVELVKSSLPDIPTVAIEAGQAVNQIMIPKQLDWIGFDRYATVDPEHDRKWLADLKAVRAARTRGDQKIVIVAETQWLPMYQTVGGVRPEDMARIAESYYRVAASDPEVVALIGYLWPAELGDQAGDGRLGARELPNNVKQTLRRIGKQIIGNGEGMGAGAATKADAVK